MLGPLQAGKGPPDETRGNRNDNLVRRLTGMSDQHPLLPDRFRHKRQPDRACSCPGSINIDHPSAAQTVEAHAFYAFGWPEAFPGKRRQADVVRPEALTRRLTDAWNPAETRHGRPASGAARRRRSTAGRRYRRAALFQCERQLSSPAGPRKVSVRSKRRLRARNATQARVTPVSFIQATSPIHCHPGPSGPRLGRWAPSRAELRIFDWKGTIQSQLRISWDAAAGSTVGLGGLRCDVK